MRTIAAMTPTDLLRDGKLTLWRCLGTGQTVEATWSAGVAGRGELGEFAIRLCVPSARRASIVVTPRGRAEGDLLSEALRLLTDHLVAAWSIHRVDLAALNTQADVMRAARGCGFVEEGRRRDAVARNGSWYDRIHFGLLEHYPRGDALDITSEPAAGKLVPAGLPPIPILTAEDFAVLRGDSVTLRRRRPSDREIFYQWQCRSEWWPLWMPEDPEGHRAPSRAEFDQTWREAASAHEWVVEDESGQPLGVCFYSGLDGGSRSAEADILLYTAECWGRGYGADALRVLVRHLFLDLGCHRVSSGTWSGNTGSVRVQEKNGFCLEATSPDAYLVRGAWYAGLGTGILEDEYLQACGARDERKAR